MLCIMCKKSKDLLKGNAYTSKRTNSYLDVFTSLPVGATPKGFALTGLPFFNPSPAETRYALLLQTL